MSNTLPTEILLGSVSLSEVEALYPDLEYFTFRDDIDKLGVALGFTSDEIIEELGGSTAQLLPYHAYLLEEQNYHRSPVNNSEKLVDRIFFSLFFTEVPRI
jgi:hypothetical protein